MIAREDIETRESEMLAPYAALARESRGRRYEEPEHPFRSAYQRDKDRIIHTTAFRRLEYKTQVFVNHEGDYYRTRLTHTMEVAQIAHVIARTLGLNEDLTEAIALAHDLGHTPFGHAGEDALQALMESHGGFEHNQHGLRVVEELEQRYPDFHGLNLTWEVRAGIIKHGMGRLGAIPEEYEPGRMPHLEAQAVEMADSIAYDSHDIDDGLAADLIREEMLSELALWRRAIEVSGADDVQDPELRRAVAVRAIINLVVTDLLEQTSRNLETMGIRSVEDVTGAKAFVLRFSPEMGAWNRELEAFLFENVYRHYRVVRMSEKAKRFLVELFALYLDNAAQLPPQYQQALETTDKHRVICDYVAGMTDRYAQDEYLRLFTPYERV